MRGIIWIVLLSALFIVCAPMGQVAMAEDEPVVEPPAQVESVQSPVRVNAIARLRQQRILTWRQRQNSTNIWVRYRRIKQGEETRTVWVPLAKWIDRSEFRTYQLANDRKRHNAEIKELQDWAVKAGKKTGIPFKVAESQPTPPAIAGAPTSASKGKTGAPVARKKIPLILWLRGIVGLIAILVLIGMVIYIRINWPRKPKSS